MTALDEAFAWLARANDELRTARDNRSIGAYRTAVSIAYRAAFAAAKAVIAYHRDGAKTHHGVATRSET